MSLQLEPRSAPITSTHSPEVSPHLTVWQGDACLARCEAWRHAPLVAAQANMASDPRWLHVMQAGLGHDVYAVEACVGDQITGLLPLAFVKSQLFGRYLVGLPYLNTGGALATDDATAQLLINEAVALADRLNVRHLQLRHEAPIEHSKLTGRIGNKVHMRLELPATSDQLWKQLSSKVRNQIRKAEKQSFTIHWGREAELAAFYDVFSHNMRDLGTPVYSRRLFAAILEHFPTSAELCVVKANQKSIAAGIVVHGQGMSQVLSASSLREFNSLCPNMFLYWHLLTRTVERGQHAFDFGRSTIDSNTYRFKEQWGATATPAQWQFYLRQGDVGDLRPEHSRFQLATRLWKRLPLAVTRWLGPTIIRGIP